MPKLFLLLGTVSLQEQSLPCESSSHILNMKNWAIVSLRIAYSAVLLQVDQASEQPAAGRRIDSGVCNLRELWLSYFNFKIPIVNASDKASSEPKFMLLPKSFFSVVRNKLWLKQQIRVSYFPPIFSLFIICASKVESNSLKPKGRKLCFYCSFTRCQEPAEMPPQYHNPKIFITSSIIKIYLSHLDSCGLSY